MAYAAVGEEYPVFSFQTAAEAVEAFTSGIDQLLAILNVLLGLAIIIALFGIANTMALSVFGF